VIVVTIANQKGGVGKTTTTVTLGHGLALRGYRVLLIDLDVQGHVAYSLGMEKEPGLYQLIVLEMPLHKLVRQARPNLWILPADKKTEAAKRALTSMNFRERVLINALEKVQGSYDVIFIDCAPSLDVLHVAALVATNWLLIPTKLDHLAIDGVNEILRSLAEVHQAGLGGQFYGVLPTFYDRVTTETLEQLRELVRIFGDKVLPPIPVNTKLREAPLYGQTIWEYAPTSRGACGIPTKGEERLGGYTALVERVEKELLQ